MAGNTNLPIFVVGTQRSGTTLLCRMLSAHRNLFILNEIGNIRECFSLKNMPHETYEFIDSEFEKSKQCSIKDFMERHGRKRWGLKDPMLTYCLDGIRKHFPESKILFIVRDGRAVANSYLKVGWGVANIYGAGERWKTEIALQRHFWETQPEISYLLRYENLLADPPNELRKVCSFIGEEFDESMVTYYEQPVFIKENSSNENVFRKIDRSIENKWKKELTTSQVRVFESVAGQQLKDLGYQLVNGETNIPTVQKLGWLCHQKVMGELQVQYQWRVKPILQKVFK